jgi:glycosyltransferase involved in cell wall biosynthesis
MTLHRIVSVHKDVSQVDDAVFAVWEQQARGVEIDLIFWNEYGLQRDQPDPELGLVPRFPTFSAQGSTVRRIWMDSRIYGLSALLRTVRESNPRVVILNDLDVGAKLKAAAHLRVRGTKVGFRSDKNPLSLGARSGLSRWLEQFTYGAAFDIFCPVSRLAVEYYGWPSHRRAALFPYSTDVRKFSRPDDDRVRNAVRKKLGIAPGAPVLLCVAKFVEREGVRDVIDAYLNLREGRDDVHLVIVGSGPQKDELHALVAANGAERSIHFVGYVPFADLQDYFFAADVYAHLARCEPWGVSVTDALCAGLGVVTTDAVGAGLELLCGRLAQYVTPAADPSSAARALERLFEMDDIAAEFREAREVVTGQYSNVATARRLAELGV